MAAALGTLRILYKQSGKIAAISIYANDTTNAAVRFDESKIAVAGSPDEYVMKEPATLIEVCMTSDLATPTALQFLRNGVPTGDIVDVTAQLASVVNRPNPAIPFAPGDKLRIVQLA